MFINSSLSGTFFHFYLPNLSYVWRIAVRYIPINSYRHLAQCTRAKALCFISLHALLLMGEGYGLTL